VQEDTICNMRAHHSLFRLPISWQIPYIWAFVDKFELQIKGLFTIDE
jgi:hypothetical protein